MSSVTTAMSRRWRKRLQSESTRAVLPEPTGPPTPTRSTSCRIDAPMHPPQAARTARYDTNPTLIVAARRPATDSVAHDGLDQRHARAHEIVGRDAHGTAQGALRLHGFEHALLRVGPIEIGAGAQDRDAPQIDQTGLRAAGQCIQRRVVFLLRGAVDALAVRQQPGPAARVVAQPAARPPGVTGERIALNHGRRLIRRRPWVVLPIRAYILAVFERRRIGQCQRLLQQDFVEAKYLGTIIELGHLVGRIGENAEIAVLPAVRQLARIDFMRDAAIDRVARPGCRTDGAAQRINAGNAGK